MQCFARYEIIFGLCLLSQILFCVYFFCCENLLIIYLLSILLRNEYGKLSGLIWTNLKFLFCPKISILRKLYFASVILLVCQCPSVWLNTIYTMRNWHQANQRSIQISMLFEFAGSYYATTKYTNSGFWKATNLCFSWLFVFVTTHYGDEWFFKNDINLWVEIINNNLIWGCHHSIHGITKERNLKFP